MSKGDTVIRRARTVYFGQVWLLAALMLAVSGGCGGSPQMIREENRHPIDRKLVDTPRGTSLVLWAQGLTAPTSIAFVNDEGEYKGALLVAESGTDGPLSKPRIYGWKQDGTFFNVYPHGRQLPPFDLFGNSHDVYGPIGGMVVYQGRIFATHRDRNGFGVISSFGFDGSVTTIQGGLPAQGDHSVTDIIVEPTTGRLYFGVGAATNSGVVGLDNWEVGWVKNYPDFCDRSYSDIKLNGLKFFTKNPAAGFFGGDDNVQTAPFQPFGHNNQLSINKSALPTAAIFSVSPSGGDLKVVAHGIRYPRGLAYSAELGLLLATNNGMELRGTRPIKDDPDAVLKIPLGGTTWYGWPDYSASLLPIDDPAFLEPTLIGRSGYPELAFLVNHDKSHLTPPNEVRSSLIYGEFPSFSGAAKLDFVPVNSNLRDFRRGGGNVIVALDGDRAPFVTSGQPLSEIVGRKIMRIQADEKVAQEFIHNTQNVPASKLGSNVEALERPNDVKFGPDGKLYILDYGRMEMRGASEKIYPGTGRIFVLEQSEPPTTSK